MSFHMRPQNKRPIKHLIGYSESKTNESIHNFMFKTKCRLFYFHSSQLFLQAIKPQWKQSYLLIIIITNRSFFKYLIGGLYGEPPQVTFIINQQFEETLFVPPQNI